MNLLSGMEKFGFSSDEELDILKEEPKKAKEVEKQKKAIVEKQEQDFLIDKKARCPICDKEFSYRSVLTTKIKRMEPDSDLRPKYEVIDKTKYDFLSCPGCGYSALNTTFATIDTARVKLIRTEFCPSFKPQPNERVPEIYDYDYSCEKFKLALICAMKKKAKMSEKALVCLKIAWLRRSQLQELEAAENIDKEKIEQVRSEYEGFYQQAYDGFMKAISTETPPYCGMPSDAVEYMLATMSVYYKKYEAASKLIARLIQAPSTSRALKDKCLNLKEEIVATLKSK